MATELETEEQLQQKKMELEGEQSSITITKRRTKLLKGIEDKNKLLTFAYIRRNALKTHIPPSIIDYIILYVFYLTIQDKIKANKEKEDKERYQQMLDFEIEDYMKRGEVSHFHPAHRRRMNAHIKRRGWISSERRKKGVSLTEQDIEKIEEKLNKVNKWEMRLKGQQDSHTINKLRLYLLKNIKHNDKILTFGYIRNNIKIGNNIQIIDYVILYAFFQTQKEKDEIWERKREEFERKIMESRQEILKERRAKREVSIQRKKMSRKMREIEYQNFGDMIDAQSCSDEESDSLITIQKTT